MGFNAAWGGIWGTNHPAPWAVDPRNMLAALVGNYGSLSTSTSSTGAGSISGAPSSGGSGACSAYDNCSLIDIGCHISGAFCSLTHSSFFEQGVLVVIGLMLALVALVVIAVRELNKARKEVM